MHVTASVFERGYMDLLHDSMQKYKPGISLACVDELMVSHVSNPVLQFTRQFQKLEHILGDLKNRLVW